MNEPEEIETLEKLAELIEGDQEDHLTKNLGVQFLEAMNDWPTRNQSRISDFINEVKEYFGQPVTIKAIRTKKISLANEHAAWKAEAGSSLNEMIHLSAKTQNKEDFDEIVRQILTYYGKKKTVHNTRS